ncbi:hypothetical protein D3C76_1634010 [compost metagenome]
MHLHVLGLTHPVSPVRRLVLYGRIPPAVEVEHMIGSRQVKAYAACFERENEYIRLIRPGRSALRRSRGLKLVNHTVAGLLGGTAV